MKARDFVRSLSVAICLFSVAICLFSVAITGHANADPIPQCPDCVTAEAITLFDGRLAKWETKTPPSSYAWYSKALVAESTTAFAKIAEPTCAASGKGKIDVRMRLPGWIESIETLSADAFTSNDIDAIWLGVMRKDETFFADLGPALDAEYGKGPVTTSDVVAILAGDAGIAGMTANVHIANIELPYGTSDVDAATIHLRADGDWWEIELPIFDRRDPACESSGK